MGRMDIDYQVLHDAFFKYQTKPRLSIVGDLYYEGREFETHLKEKKPGQLSAELKVRGCDLLVGFLLLLRVFFVDAMLLVCNIEFGIGALSVVVLLVNFRSQPDFFIARAGSAGDDGGCAAAVAHQHATLRPAALVPLPQDPRSERSHPTGRTVRLPTGRLGQAAGG